MTLINKICKTVMLGFLLMHVPCPLPSLAVPEVQQIDISEPKAHDLFMWKVKTPVSTAYLVGSIHMLPPDFFPLPGDIEKAFNKSPTLIVEANIDDRANETRQMMMSR